MSSKMFRAGKNSIGIRRCTVTTEAIRLLPCPVRFQNLLAAVPAFGGHRDRRKLIEHARALVAHRLHHRLRQGKLLERSAARGENRKRALAMRIAGIYVSALVDEQLEQLAIAASGGSVNG